MYKSYQLKHSLDLWEAWGDVPREWMKVDTDSGNYPYDHAVKTLNHFLFISIVYLMEEKNFLHPF